MRIFLTIIVLSGMLQSFAQFSDNFADGDYLLNPVWNGDSTKFEVNVSKQLHLNAPAVTDVAYLSTASTAIDSAEWQFYLKMDFAPSTSNFVKVYLVSNISDLRQTSINGYYLRIGETLSADAVELYKQTGTTSVKLLRGKDSLFTNSVNATFKVTRDNTGKWEVFADTAAGANFQLQNSITDNTHTASGYFGMVCTFTSSNSTTFFFDDFNVSGKVLTDTTPPQLSTITILSDSSLDLKFSEKVNATGAILTNYSVSNGIGNPSSAVIDAVDSSKVKLIFSNKFTSGTTYTLTVSNVADNSGNTMTVPGTNNFLYYIVIPALYKDVVFNEFMPKLTPDPPTLPDREFVELYNNSPNVFDLSGWSFINTTTAKILPTFLLQPSGFVILCDDLDTALFAPYGNVIGIPSWSALTDGGDSLTLIDSGAKIIDVLSYSSSWNGYTTGGISMEISNPRNPCGNLTDWKMSTELSGGTPGKKNSVFDTITGSTAPALQNATALSDSTIELTFSKSMDSASVAGGTYTFSSGYVKVTVTVDPADFAKATILLAPLLKEGEPITVTANNVMDCSANLIGLKNSASVVLPQPAQQGDIIINEVLFNPRTGGSDFVEIYNPSVRYINLNGWQLANWDKTKDTIANNKTIATMNKIIFPGQYMLFSSDTANIRKEYPLSNVDALFQMSSLPSYNDDSGTVFLIDGMNRISDNFSYNDKMHFALIDDVNGVSLERLDFKRSTNDALNWHSAAQTVGFATPGYKNSQYYAASAIPDPITIEPEIFSPDNDGYNDVTTIGFKFAEPGYVANITIFDAKGRTIRNLIQNRLLGNEGIFTWDGINDNREKARIGIYVIYFEVFNLSGDVKKYKKSCVVGGRL